MPLHSHSPTYELACNDFIEKYVDLFDEHRVKWGIFEASIIKAKEEAIFLAALEGRDRLREYRTVRATNNAFAKAAMRGNTHRMIIVIQNSLDNFQSGFNDACQDYWEARKMGDDVPYRARMMLWMSAYQTLYESLLRIVYAPVCTAYHLIDKKLYGDEFKLDNGGRARLKAIKSIEKKSPYEIEFYRLGLNHTLRNATAHRHYEIFEHEEYVEYWDGTTARKRITADEIRQLCGSAFHNASAIVDAIVLWFVNHRSVGEKRGWLRESKPREVGKIEFEQAVKAMFDQYSLTVSSVDRSASRDHRFCLRTRSRGIDQTSTIYRGGDEWTESFDVEVKFEEVEILPEILDVLFHVVRGYKTGTTLVIEVSNQDGKSLGRVSAKAGFLRKLKGPSTQPLANVRKGLDEDSLGGQQMWVEVRSAPERATPRLRVDKKN